MKPNEVLWKWRLQTNPDPRPKSIDMPTHIVTFAAGFQPANLSPEISMLLPTVSGAKQITEALTTSPQLFKNVVTGLLVTDPTINFERTVTGLKAANCQWIANLPSISLHEAEFKSYLNEVALGFSREIEILADFKTRDFKIMAVLADRSEAPLMAALNPEAVLIMPKVTDFLKGWPSLAMRENNEAALRKSLDQNGWTGSCFGYRAPDENSNGWPCVKRPCPFPC